MADEMLRRVANLEQKVEHHEERLDRHDVQIGSVIGLQQKFDLELEWLAKRVEARKQARVRRSSKTKK